MGGKSCFFIGHRETSEAIYQALYAVVEQHIWEYGVTEFIVGHYGGFDRLAASAVKEAKRFYPEVKLTLLLSYHPAERPIPTPDGFDGTFYPPGMESVPRKIAIVRANRYVVDHVDYEEYLRQIVELARKVHKPESGTEYPPEIRESAAKRAFYDHLNRDTVVANQIYDAVMSSKQDNFRGSKIKERKIWRAIRAVVKDDQEADQLLALVKEQSEF